MQRVLKSPKSMRKMPLPDQPVVEGYGRDHTGSNHSVYLFPAVVRSSNSANAETMMEGGQASCFFHKEAPATALCDVSGRMICDLCKTGWNGKTVSMAALQSLVKGDSSSGNITSRINWDTIALTLVILPILVWPLLVLTPPIALGICLFKWRAGVTSIVRRSRWRYVVAAIIAILEILWGAFFWVGFLSAINGI